MPGRHVRRPAAFGARLSFSASAVRLKGDHCSESVVKLSIGDQIRLTADEFERLSAAFFEELERRFL
jgi:hypothetical protein